MRTDDVTLACQKMFRSGALTLGLMTPAARKPGHHADVATELAVARRADRYGVAALWARQAPWPVAADAGQIEPDDPFVWLAALGAAAPTAALVAQSDWLRHDRAQLLNGARSLQRVTGGRCALGVAGADEGYLSRLVVQAPAPRIALLHLDGAGQHHPVMRQVTLDLDECAGARGAMTGQVWHGGRIALAAELERLADAGVAHVLLHLVRNGRPVLDIIDELGTEVIPRLAAVGAARCDDAGEAR